MTGEDKFNFNLKMSFGCIAFGFLMFAGIVFTIAAAIKWIAS